MPANTQLGAADLIGRELPYSIEAEQTVIGALLLSPDSISTALKYLKPESFYHTQHREIFSIILRMFSNGVPADVITVIRDLRDGQGISHRHNGKCPVGRESRQLLYDCRG